MMNSLIVYYVQISEFHRGGLPIRNQHGSVRIHQLQLHRQQLERDKETEIKRKRQRRTISVSKIQAKKSVLHEGNDLEL